MKSSVYPALFERMDSGSYCGSFPDHPVCGTVGVTLDECRKTVSMTLKLHLSEM